MSNSKPKIAMLGSSLEQNGGIASVENLIIQYAPSEVKIQHITTHDEGSITHRSVVFGKSLVVLLGKLLRREIALVHIHVSERGSVARKVIVTLLALTFRKPVLIHAHGAEFESFFQKLPKSIQQGIKFTFGRCTGFIALSKTWKEFYIQNLGLKAEQVFVLPNAVELPSQVPHRINSTQVTLLFLGRVGQRKGAFDLIQAFANLSAEQKESSVLILAGDGDVEQGRELVESLSLTERVTFLGWVNSQQRNQLLAEADIFVLPSYNEGLPMALLEAMSWSLPVITTPVGGIPELVTPNQTGVLVHPGEIQQLSEAMQSLITDENLRLSLGKAARESVAPFDIKTYGSRLGDIYRSILPAS